MGMFTYIRCTQVMPDGFQLDGIGNNGLFQTKDLNDFGCYVAEIADGKLVTSASMMLNSLEKTDTYGIEYIGELEFYANDDRYANKLRRYTALVNDGKVVYIRTVKTHKTPYKRKVQHREPKPYTSKAFRAYQVYLNARYGDRYHAFGESIASSLYEASNREGFMRKFLVATTYTEEEKQKRAEEKAQRKADAKKIEDALLARMAARAAETKPYSRHLRYDIPKNWVTWEKENGMSERSEPVTNKNVALIMSAFN